MTDDCLKLTTYFGERDRAGDRSLADALLHLYDTAEVRASVLLRGVEGFGVKHRLATSRSLTLSEDLPLVSVALDTSQRIERLVPEVARLSGHGLITLERARLLEGAAPEPPPQPEPQPEAAKLTVYVGRGERVGGRPAYLAVVDALREHGIAGATVLLGVDGTIGGARRRARLLSRNAGVPLMIVAVGDGPRIAGLLPALGAMLERPLLTLERVRVCKRDGVRLTEPRALPDADPSGLPVWGKLMVVAGERARHAGRPLAAAIVRDLRADGAAGATTLRGLWGFYGDHAPHGDVLGALRRRVPTLTVIVDAPERLERWFALVDELTDETGLVTSEIVPALRATGPEIVEGGLRLAARP